MRGLRVASLYVQQRIYTQQRTVRGPYIQSGMTIRRHTESTRSRDQLLTRGDRVGLYEI